MPFLPKIDPTIVSLIRDDLRLTTWLLLGASLQSLLVYFLPTRIAFLPAVSLLSYRVITTALITGGLIHHTSQDPVLYGRFTAQIPETNSASSEKRSASDEEVVVFIVGARSNQ